MNGTAPMIVSWYATCWGRGEDVWEGFMSQMQMVAMRALLGRYTGAAREVRGRYEGAKRELRGRYEGDTRELRGRYGATRQA